MTTDFERRLMRVIDHVHDHPAEDLNLDRLARVAALSPYHFHRVFRGITGETLAHMVRRVRMERAATLLTFGTLPIAEIAQTVGYPNVASFTRAFSEMYGLPPGAYRERGTHRSQLLNLRQGARIMTRPVEIRQEPARRLAGILHRGPYQELTLAINQLFGTLAARNLMEQSQGMACVFHDDPDAVQSPELRSHCGVIVDAQFPVEAPLEELNLPGGRYAVMLHKGPYSGLSEAYDELFSVWLPSSGQEPGEAPLFETYLNSARDTPPDQLETEIHLKLKD